MLSCAAIDPAKNSYALKNFFRRLTYIKAIKIDSRNPMKDKAKVTKSAIKILNVRKIPITHKSIINTNNENFISFSE